MRTHGDLAATTAFKTVPSGRWGSPPPAPSARGGAGLYRAVPCLSARTGECDDHAHDQVDPAPRGEIERVRVVARGDEYVVLGDGGDALEDHHQSAEDHQDGGEDEPAASGTSPRRTPCRRTRVGPACMTGAGRASSILEPPGPPRSSGCPVDSVGEQYRAGLRRTGLRTVTTERSGHADPTPGGSANRSTSGAGRVPLPGVAGTMPAWHPGQQLPRVHRRRASSC